MEELNELKNLVMQNLQKKGYLSNIRAQIRSSVFKTIDGQQSNKKVSPFLFLKCKVQKMVQTPEGQNSLQLIKELMQAYNMQHSTIIFSSQSNMKQPAKREVLELKNKLSNVPPEKPILLQLVQKFVKGSKNKKPVQNKQKKIESAPKPQEIIGNVQQNQSEGEIEEEIVKNQSKKFGQSDQFGQSQGYDVSVDSLKLEEYDYYEEIN